MDRKGFSDIKTVLHFLNQSIHERKVLVVGDVMLDRYYFGEVNRISPEAPVPVALVRKVQDTLGGAANVCNNLALLGCRVTLAGLTGADDSGRRLRELLVAKGIGLTALLEDKHRPTVSKTRIIGGHQQILRLDFEEVQPPASRLKAELKRQILLLLDGIDSVVLSDYAKGACEPELCQWLIRQCAERGIPVLVDPKGNNWRKYRGAFLVTPNLKELGEVAHKPIENLDAVVEKLARKIRERFNLSNVLVTRSEKGLSLTVGDTMLHVPTAAQEVFDVSGAGDTVMAVLAAAVAEGLPLADGALLANLAAGIVVGKLGTYAISREELLRCLENR